MKEAVQTISVLVDQQVLREMAQLNLIVEVLHLLLYALVVYCQEVCIVVSASSSAIRTGSVLSGSLCSGEHIIFQTAWKPVLE